MGLGEYSPPLQHSAAGHQHSAWANGSNTQSLYPSDTGHSIEWRIANYVKVARGRGVVPQDAPAATLNTS